MDNSVLDDWKTTRLVDITTKIGSGATPRGGKKSYKTEGISLIRSLNVYDFEFSYNELAFIDEAQAELLANVEVHKNDILLNITGASVARCCLVPDAVLPARVNQHVALVRVDKEKADSFFVQYTINSPFYKKHLLNLAQGGATREALTKSTIQNFEIPLPYLPTQHKIASILSAYDELIENNTRRIQILEEMAQRIYREWFVHFRFPGHENVKMVESELGVIPEGWEIVNLLDIADVTYGFPFKSKLFSNDSSGKIVIRIRDIRPNKSGTYTHEDAPEKYIVENGDILVGMDGEFHAGKWAGGQAFLNQRVARFRPKAGLSTYFIFFSLVTPVRRLNQAIVGTTVAHLSAKDVKAIRVIKPDDVTLTKCHGVFEPLLREKIILQQKNENLRQTRDLLLPKLISGRIDVSDMDIEIRGNDSGLDNDSSETEVPEEDACEKQEEETEDPQNDSGTSSTNHQSTLEALDRNEIMAVFRKAARTCGLTDRETLLKEISLLLGYKRMRSEIKATLKGHLKTAIRRKVIGTNGPEAWLETPTIEFYERSQLVEVLRSVMHRGREYPREDVIRAVANHIGFKRLMEKITAAIKSAINSAIRKGDLISDRSTIKRIV